MKEQLYKVIDSYPTIKSMIVGDIMLDEYIFGNAGRLSPEAPVPIVEAKSTKCILGGAANVANNIASLGATAFIVGVVGDDDYSIKFRELLNKSKINYDGIVVDTTRPTTVKTRIIAHNNQQLARIDREDKKPISSEIEEKLKKEIDKKIDIIDVIIISDYAKGVLTAELVQYIIKIAKSNNKLVLADPKGLDYTKYTGVDLITPNRAEAEAALKMPQGSDVSALATELCHLVKSKHGFITLGEDGVVLSDDDKITHIKTVATDVYDVTGAGDTLISTTALSLAVTKEDYALSIKLGNCAAGVAVRKVGTSTVTPDELKEIISISNLKKISL